MERLEIKLSQVPQERMAKRERKLKLDRISNKFHQKQKNAKEILKRIKKAGLTGNQLEIDVAAQELKLLEKEQAEAAIEQQLNERADDNKKYTEKNRLFKRIEAGKMYTDRYVRRLKVAHNKLLDKFTMGSKYALRAQKRQIMARASRLVVDSHDKLIQTFQKEAMALLT